MIKKEHCNGCLMNDGNLCGWYGETIQYKHSINYDQINRCIGDKGKQKAYIENLVHDVFEPADITVELIQVIFGKTTGLVMELAREKQKKGHKNIIQIGDEAKSLLQDIMYGDDDLKSYDDAIHNLINEKEQLEQELEAQEELCKKCEGGT